MLALCFGEGTKGGQDRAPREEKGRMHKLYIGM